MRLVERTVTWNGYVRLAFDEIFLAGAPKPQVTPKTCAALADLTCVTSPEQQEPLDRPLRLLTATVRRTHDDEEDVRAALTSDTEGIGSGADMTATPPRHRSRPPEAPEDPARYTSTGSPAPVTHDVAGRPDHSHQHGRRSRSQAVTDP